MKGGLVLIHRPEAVMKAGMRGTTCLLDVAGKDSVKDSGQVPLEGNKVESPAPESVIKAGKGEKAASRMEENAVSIQKKDIISGGGNSQSEASTTQYDPDSVEHTMEEKEKIHGEWNSPREATNT